MPISRICARLFGLRIRSGSSAICDFEGETEFPQLGINVSVLGPGEHVGMYHWEADQEDFLVVAGEAVLIVEGEERPLRAWDFVHCPPNTKHVVVGAGSGPCVVIAVGARDHSAEPYRMQRLTAFLHPGDKIGEWKIFAKDGSLKQSKVFKPKK